ncbi:hypothetical protein JCM15640A_13550 [Hoylesella timonensis 4401737 = DSM 22865 = JCM 15640]|uniref:hypothetical protein n=1 Tax=Hoylesella timonensis TaxID=386414 RepID=UPI0004097982|nr:hypothetical protein [Hoylesella timonensis]
MATTSINRSNRQLCKTGTVIIALLLTLSTTHIHAQSSFDEREGCLNVVNTTVTKGTGKYGDDTFSMNYQHERFINEQWSIGAGIGYNYHSQYRLAIVPVFVSSTFFFTNTQWAPFVNVQLGSFGIIRKGNIDTNTKYSTTLKNTDFNLLMSPSIGIKLHLSSHIGLMTSITIENILLKIYNDKQKTYTNKIISSIGINIGIFFQIKGW